MNTALDNGVVLMKQHYLATWSNILRGLLQWSDAQVAEWIASAHETWDLDNSESWIYHERPSYWIVETIIEYFLPDISESDCESLDRQILALLDADRQDLTRAIDWDAYRSCLDQVLKPYRGGVQEFAVH